MDAMPISDDKSPASQTHESYLAAIAARLRASVSSVDPAFELVDGIWLDVDRDHDGNWRYAETPEIDGVRREVSMHVASGEWVVSVDEHRRGKEPHNFSRALYSGGLLVGVGKSMGYDAAHSVALRWLSGGDLDYMIR